MPDKPDLSKRYWLFTCEAYEGRCGMNDLHSTYDELTKAFMAYPAQDHWLTHVFDSREQKVVAVTIMGEWGVMGDVYGRGEPQWITRDNPKWREETHWESDTGLY